MRTIKTNKLFNLNLFPIAIFIVMAVMGGLIGCGGDAPYCEAVAAGGDYSRCDCFDEDGQKVWSKVFLPGDTDVPGECFIPPSGTTPSTGTCSVTDTNKGALITCPDGTSTVISDGTDGVNGRDGYDGLNGTGCSVQQVTGGALITCSDGSSAFISDGKDGTDGTGGSGGTGGTGGSGGTGGGTTNPPTTGWQVMEMGISPTDQLLTCNGQPISPSTSCAGTVGWNRSWLETRTSQVYNGAFTNLAFLATNSYSEAFPGFIGAFCSRNNGNLGNAVTMTGAPVASAIKIANASAYADGPNQAGFTFEYGDQSPAVVCWLSVDYTAFSAQ